MSGGITRQLDEAELYFGRERELLETVASLARATPEGVLVWRGTNAQLAETLSCSERTLGRAWSAVRAMRLPWLDVSGTRGAGLYVRIAPASNGQPTDIQRSTCRQATDNQRTGNGQLTANLQTSNGQATDNLQPNNGQITDSRARVPYSKILPTEELIASKATREAPSDVDMPASQPALDLAGWMASELERRAGALVQRPKPLPSAAALESAAASLLATLGDDEAARRYCAARLVSYEERPAQQRPGTMARLIAWLLADSARAAAESSSEAAPARPTSQSFVSEGFDHDLAAAVEHGTRHAEDTSADDAWEAQLYREQCEQAFKTAKYFGEIPKDLEYSDEAMTRYGLWPKRGALMEALR